MFSNIKKICIICFLLSLPFLLQIWVRPDYLDRAWSEFSRKVERCLAKEKRQGASILLREEVSVGQSVAVEVNLGSHYR